MMSSSFLVIRAWCVSLVSELVPAPMPVQLFWRTFSASDAAMAAVLSEIRPELTPIALALLAMSVALPAIAVTFAAIPLALVAMSVTF